LAIYLGAIVVKVLITITMANPGVF